MTQKGLSKSFVLIFIAAACVSCDSEDNGNRVLLGKGNKLLEIGNLQYQEELTVQVSGPDGSPSPNTFVTLRLRPLTYNKGFYIATDIDIPPDGAVDRWDTFITALCPSEDTNNNGALDLGEDTNGNGVLDPDVPSLTEHPDKTPTITPGSNILVTDENGFGYFTITFPKSEGAWSEITVMAEVSDGLAGSNAAYNLSLGVLIKDLDDLTVSPPGDGTSPYGFATICSNPT